ncbi:MAG: hypothetical protein HS126_40380 [Anaerolineales bacterium]|nr:hypothetical protein [Anaerolineales bacterium]
MLPLDSPKWSELHHVYGQASDIPSLLRQLKTAPPPEKYNSPPWGALWSSLYHQRDVDTASYAAVPHIVSIAVTKPIRERIHHISLVGTIEINRHLDKAPPIPDFLREAYFDALKQIPKLVLECLELDWEDYEYKALFSALVAVRGKVAFGEAISELDDAVTCPTCDTIFVTPGYDTFKNYTIESEGIKEFRKDDPAVYEVWLAENPSGFVLFAPVAPPLNYVIQHRVGCSELKLIENSQEYFKVCAPDFHRVTFWLFKYGITPHGLVRECKVCKA